MAELKPVLDECGLVLLEGVELDRVEEDVIVGLHFVEGGMEELFEVGFFQRRRADR